MAVDRTRLPEPGPDGPFTFPAVIRHTVGAGLEIRTVEHWSVPVVTFLLQIAGGSGADLSGREGLAALTADMADEGTGALTAIDVSESLARISAEYDVDVGADATTFSLVTLTRFAREGATLLADMVVRPSLRETDFDRVRQLRLDRLRQLKDLPPAVAERAFLALLYGPHPYGHLPIGTDASLRALGLADVSAFHQSTFRAPRATLVAAGAMSHDELVGIAEAAFQGWMAPPSSAGDPRAAADVDPEQNSRTRLAIVAREHAAQSEVRIGHLSARRNTPDYPALLVMNAVLGGLFVSRINLKLREEKGFTYGARTGFDWRRGLAPFSLQASVHTAATAEAIHDSLGEIEAIRGSRPPSESEMTLAKASLTRGYPRNFETAPQVARSVAQLALYGLPDSYFEEFVPLVNAVGVDDVVDVAQRYLHPESSTTLIVGDHSAIEPSVRQLGLGDPVVLPAG